jgi:endonuclease/exonuclease/phosphatase family metal-dependent hydrolase
VAYNFQSGGSPRRAGHWSRIRARLAPDIVLAQECRPPEDSPAETFRAAEGDTFLWAPAVARRWGSGMLLRGLRAAALPVPDFAGWVVGAELPGPAWSRGRRLRVFSIHCPAGERGYVRTMHAILDRVARLRGDADLVLGGDFNVAVGTRQPGEPIRVSRGEREILDRLAAEFDLISCWQAANPGRRLAQTLRWSADPSAPYHCDGIFVPSLWGARLASCRVVTGSRWKRLSDHNPVLAEFSDGDPGAGDGRRRRWRLPAAGAPLEPALGLAGGRIDRRAGLRRSGRLTPPPRSGAAGRAARARSRG